jgi:glycosyltransferase involved in cell wall biosynthesis
MAAEPRIAAIVPLRDKRAFLEASLGSILAAAARHGAVEILVVDNGSVDGSLDAAQRMLGGRGRVESAPGVRVGAVRNLGARRTTAPLLSFIDADCVVPEDYFVAVEHLLSDGSCEGAGCWVDLPADGPWVERVWHQLHYREREGRCPYLNTASFAVRRQAFDAVGGFDESLESGEDAAIGMRLNDAGFRLFESRRLRVLHLDNPRTLRAFYRKEVWRALGMFATVRRTSLDRPTAMTFLHGALLIAAVAIVVAAPLGWSGRVALAAAALVAVPAVTVSYRMAAGRRLTALLPAVVLYWVYYAARLTALARLTWRALARRRGARAGGRAEG